MVSAGMAFMIGGAQSNATWKNEKVYIKDFRFAPFLSAQYRER